MTQNQKILIGLASVGVVFYLLWKSKKNDQASIFEEDKQCEEEYLAANHPDIVRTPEEQEEYKKSWISDCKRKKQEVGTRI